MQRRVKFFFPGLALVGMCLATVTYAQEVRPQGNPDSRYSLGATAPQTVPQTAPQTSPQAAPQTAPQAASPTILHRETGSPSDIIYVRDEYGRLRPIVRGLSWSEFDALLKRLLQQNPEPLHSIHSLDAEGQVTDNMADLTIQLRIQTKNEPIVRIPLGLKSGIFLFETDLSQVAQYDGPSQFAIVANPQGNGYDMILQASDFRLRTADFDGRDEVANADRATPSSKSEGSSETPSSKSDDSSETPSPKSEGSPETPSPKSDDSSETPSSKSEGSSETPSSKSEVLFPEVPSRTQAVFPVSPEDEPQPQRFLWHTVTLRMAFPITQPSIGEYQWKAEFPAALSSRVQLAVPQQNAVVLQTKDGNLRQTILSDERRTTFVFQGTSNDFEVRWHEKQHVPLQERVVLQAENGRIVAKVTPAGVMFDATIPVQSSGGVLDSFQIRLPLGAVYRPNPASVATEYQIEEEFREQPETSEQPSKASPATVLVRLSQPTEGPVVVRVQAETPIHPSRNDWFEVGGFEVVGAVKQIGKLSVVVPPETRLSQHQESRGVRPGIDATVNETEGIVSSFEYYEQPCSLLVQAVPQAARVRLGQEYQVQIHRNRAVLHAKLSYTIHGSQKQVTIHMNGWQLTNIGPDNMVNRNEPPFMESGPVTISLHEPVGKTVELNLQAERVYDSNDGLIRFPFPIPDADSMEPAFVAILSEDNIELTVDESRPLVAMSQKSRRDTPLQIELPVRQQGALVYQIDHPDQAEFCAKMTVQPQRITVQSHTELTLQSDESVKQTLDYTVDYEYVSRLILAVPAELDSQGDLRVMFESGELSLFNLSEMTVPGNSQNGLILKQVRLPDAIIGKFQLVLDFKLTSQIRDDFIKNLPTSTVQVKVPIVLPYDGQLVQETVHVRYPHGLQLTHDEEATGWKKTDLLRTPGAFSRSESVYQTEMATPLLLLGAALKNTDRFDSTTIEKGWVRSWLLGSGRFDYACYRISTNRSHLTVKLPDQVRVDSMIAKVDDRAVAFHQKDGELTIPLLVPPNDSLAAMVPQLSSAWLDFPERETLHTLELWYEVPLATSVNQLALDMPSFRPEVLVRPVYCQVILPNTRHLLACNPEWMPQYRWRFDGGFFLRKPDLTQQELEDWIGVAHSEPISPVLNSYLFITFHPGPQIELDLVDRSTLILISSGLILLLGLILIYFPRTRYPGVLFASLVLFLSAFAYRTTAGVLFLQAGVIGFILALIALFLYRIFVIADPWRGLTSGSLPTFGQKDHSRFVHPEMPFDEHPSDLTGVRVVSSDQADSGSHHSRTVSALPMKSDYNASDRKNDDAVQQDHTHMAEVPKEEERNGHA